MCHSHGGRDLVDVLTAGAARMEDIDLEIAFVDVDFDFLNGGQHRHRRRRCVDTPLRLGGRHALHAMRATLVLQAGVCATAMHLEHHFLNTADADLVRREQKYSGAFQKYLAQMAPSEDTETQELARGSVDHSTAGAQAIWERLKPKGARGQIAGEILALCVASHHSGLIDCIAPDGSDNLSRRLSKADSETHRSEAWANVDAEVAAEAELLLGDPEVINGVIKIIEDIARKEGSNETILRFKVGLLVRLLFSCLIDADRTDTADSASPQSALHRQRGKYVGWTELGKLLEVELTRIAKESTVGKLQSQVSGRCLTAAAWAKGIYSLTVPTGGGKTLASLRFALAHAGGWKMDRVIYVSPYTSIIEQNADVVRVILEPPGAEVGSIVLEHHSNLTPDKQTWRNKVLSENWDAPVVFTTGVQVLEALFGSGTRAVRRMHQMTNAVIVFDEIQTLPVRCVHLFNNAINFLKEHCESSVLMCTATQPLLHQVDEQKGALRRDGEIMSDVPALFASLRRHLTTDRRKAGGWEYSEAVKLALAETERAGSCLVVVNTKLEARSIFKECRSSDRFGVLHLSADMCPAHRLNILKELRSRLNMKVPVICVSTQLIEAGVDISFASAIRALAGLDSIIQTAGRCNRNGELTEGHVHVINLKGKLPKALREIELAQESAQRVLDDFGRDGLIDLSDPGLAEQYFRWYFFERKKEMAYPVGPKEAERDDTLLNMLSTNCAAAGVRPRSIYLRQAFMRAARCFQAIDANTRGVIVPYLAEGKSIIAELCGSQEPRKQFALLRRAQRFTVNAYPHVLEKLGRDGALYEVKEGSGILCLQENRYSNDFGLNAEGSQEMEAMFA